MNPNAHALWPGPRWSLTLLLACLGMLGPFSIDTYLPAFAGIAQSIGATPAQMQQTLSSYLFGFALMNLFHGALSDSVGRRPVVVVGALVFALASIGCATADSIAQLVLFRGLQGMAAGSGMVVSRAVIRDLFPPEEAQRVMSQVSIWFGIAPAIAPLFGGYLFVHAGWHSIFWFLCLLALALAAVCWRRLPESLPRDARQSFHPLHLLRGYLQLGRSTRFMALVLASGVPFNGMFLYVLSAPVFLSQHVGLPPTRFFWFFLATIAFMMSGAWLSGRLAGRIRPHRQIRHGFAVMGCMALFNVALNLLVARPGLWAIVPVAGFAFGWALMTPVVTLITLDLVPDRRGMAASVQASVGSAANAVVAGLLAPWVMHSTIALATTSLALFSIGVVAWWWVRPRLAADALERGSADPVTVTMPE
jgi:DHA1 family bicyclomycin/chloramphenicol resistance-like MFS transporter